MPNYCYDVLAGRDARAMTHLCPKCARLGVEWLKAVEKRDALDDSIAPVALREAAYVDEFRAFMAYVLRQRKCTECVRSESWNYLNDRSQSENPALNSGEI